MKVVITDEDTIKQEEKIAINMVKDLLLGYTISSSTSDWKVEQIERIIRRMASNITNSQLWRHT